MKVVYIFLSPGPGIYHLAQKMLPQLEDGRHGSKIVGMCFFDDNAFILEKDNSYGVRLAKIAEQENIVLMIAQKSDLIPNANRADISDHTAKYQRRLKPSECSVITVSNGEQVGCFPDLYAALGDNRPDHLISL